MREIPLTRTILLEEEGTTEAPLAAVGRAADKGGGTAAFPLGFTPGGGLETLSCWFFLCNGGILKNLKEK